MKQMLCCLSIFSLLSACILCSCAIAPPSSPSASEETPSSPTFQTQPSTHQVPVIPTEIPTIPPTSPSSENVSEYIGNLYTRQQLEAFNKDMFGFGPGRFYCNKRPSGSLIAQNEYGSYNATFIGADNPTVYLTFDCGYEHENITAIILDILKEKNVKAVFFVTLHYCKTQPQLVQRMIDEGHTIGNHSSNHRHLPTLDIDTITYEIMSLHQYVKDNFNYEMTLFRPPSGYYSAQTLALTQSLGYQSVFWSFAYCDWDTEKQPEEEEALYTISSCAHNGCIYLLHAVSATNAKVLGTVIDNIRSSGYVLELFS